MQKISANNSSIKKSNTTLITRLSKSYATTSRKLLYAGIVAAALYLPVHDDIIRIQNNGYASHIDENKELNNNKDLLKTILLYTTLIGAGALLGVKKDLEIKTIKIA